MHHLVALNDPIILNTLEEIHELMKDADNLYADEAKLLKEAKDKRLGMAATTY
jgi:hypothetical protein